MVLVTGGAGFIGSHLVARLKGAGERVRVLDNLRTGRRSNLDGLEAELVVGDICDADTLGRVMRGAEVVYHLAACPGVPDSCEDPIGFDHINVHGTVKVFQAARELGVGRVVYASSSAVYGSGPHSPKTEDLPIVTESPYAASKAANELYAQAFSRTLGVDCVGLRFFNVFGPRQDPEGPYAAVIPRFLDRALSGRSLTVFGDGGQTRDFVYVTDVAEAHLAASTAEDVGGRVYNIGSGESLSVLRLAETVREVVDTDVEIEFLPERPGDVRDSRSDPSRALADLGWRARTPFTEAMQATFAWYCAQQDSR